MVDELIEVATGARLHYRRIGSGEPLLLAMGTAATLGMWMPVEAALAEHFDVVSFDARGLGGSERGDGAITAGTQAEDARALLDALSIPRAHALGWSFGSVVAQELALTHPDRVSSLVLYGTWARPDGVMTALLTALKYPWEQGDLATALATLGVVYSLRPDPWCRGRGLCGCYWISSPTSSPSSERSSSISSSSSASRRV